MIQKPMKIIGKAAACLFLLVFTIQLAGWSVTTIYDEVTYSSTSATLGRMDTLISQGKYNELREQLSWSNKSYLPAYDGVWEIVKAYDFVCDYEMYVRALDNSGENSASAYADKALSAKEELQKICEESTVSKNKRTLDYFMKRVNSTNKAVK